MFKGNMMSIKEISQLTGLGRKMLEKRIQKGIPLDLPKMGRVQLYIPFRGKMLRPREIAPIIGVSSSCIVQRYSRGQEIDATPHPGEEHVPANYSRTRNFYGTVLNHKRPYVFDTQARYVMRYFQSCELVSTDEEIRAEAAKWLHEECGLPADTRISDEGVAWLREELRQELFVHRHQHGETLETLGDIEGVCRERIRQLEIEAMRVFRAAAVKAGVAGDMLDELRERDARRKVTWAEVMDEKAPGYEAAS